MALIDNDFVEKLDSGDITQLVDALGIRTKGKGVHQIISCISPTHKDQNPSMSINTTTGAFCCHGCGAAGGGLLQFVALHDNLDYRNSFRDVVKRTASLMGEQVIYANEDPAISTQRQAINYLEEQITSLGKPSSEELVKFIQSRGLQAVDIKDFTLKYVPKSFGIDFDRRYRDTLEDMGLYKQLDKGDRKKAFGFFRFNEELVFPIKDAGGRVIAYAGRKLGDFSGPKYVNSNNSDLFKKSKVLYGLDVALKRHGENRRLSQAVVVEGYMDVIASSRIGIKGVVGTMGTAFTDEHLKTLRRHTDEVVFLFDPDPAGKAAADRALQTVAPYTDTMKFKFAYLPEGPEKLDPDALIRAGRADELFSAIDNATPFSLAAAEYITRGASLVTADDLVGDVSNKASTLYLSMPPSIVREAMSQQIAAAIGKQLNLPIQPEMMGMRLEAEAVYLNFQDQVQSPTAESQIESSRPTPSESPKAPETKIPVIDIPVATPASPAAKWIGAPSSSDPNLIEIFEVKEARDGFFVAQNPNTQVVINAAASDILELPVLRAFPSKFADASKGVAVGDTIFNINGKWMKDIHVEDISVVSDLSPYRQSAAEAKKPAPKESQPPGSQKTSNEVRRMKDFLTNAKQSEWVAQEIQGGRFMIGKVSTNSPQGAGQTYDVGVHWLASTTGRLDYVSYRNIHGVKVDRVMESKCDNPEIGVTKGDTIFLIGGAWHGPVANAEFEVKAKSPKKEYEPTSAPSP